MTAFRETRTNFPKSRNEPLLNARIGALVWAFNGEHFPALHNILPLLGGEGRGEVERFFLLNVPGGPAFIRNYSVEKVARPHANPLPGGEGIYNITLDHPRSLATQLRLGFQIFRIQRL